MAKQELRNLKLDGDLKEQEIKKTAKEAEKTFHEAGSLAFDRGVKEGMAGGVPGVEGQPDDAGVLQQPPGGGGENPFAMGGDPMDLGGGPPGGPVAAA
jgi:hypothetical protein